MSSVYDFLNIIDFVLDIRIWSLSIFVIRTEKLGFHAKLAFKAMKPTGSFFFQKFVTL